MTSLDNQIPELEAALATIEQLLRSVISAEPADDEGIRDALRTLVALTTEASYRVEGLHEWDRAVLESDEEFQSAPAPLLTVDNMGFIERINTRAAILAGVEPSKVVGSHVGDFIHNDDYNTFADIWVRMQVEANFDAAVIEFRLITPAGAVWQRAALRASRDDQQQLLHITAHFVDIHDKYATQVVTERSNRGFGNLLDSLPDPIIRLNRNSEVQFSNPAAAEWCDEGSEGGWPRVGPDDIEAFEQAMEDCWSSGLSTTIEHSLRVRGGTRWCESTLVAEHSASGPVQSILVIWRDLTLRRKHEAMLAYQASRDPLTGLLNRGKFSESLERAILRQTTAHEVGVSRPLAVLFLDLDRFKFVNDSLGHAAGDELLRDVAKRLSRAIRPGDVLGRLGGDEFTILAEDITPADALSMAERIQDGLAVPFDLYGREFLMSASIGVMTSESPESAEDLMRWADSAMYRAKSMGRSCIATFDDVLRPEAMEQLELDQYLRTALDRGELEVHYQPEVKLATAEIVGVEALVRWRHPNKGLITAGEFIPLAEDNGTVVSIGAWVLETACRQVDEWTGDGLIDSDFVLRVNLSARQLELPSLIMDISNMLTEVGFDPERLCLEITETALMRDVDHALVTLDRLHALGIKLAVDDFGTGYSSLSSLKRFPIQVLKVDQSFIDGLPNDPHDSAIVSTVLRLAESLGLSATAEGVETEKQREALIELGCPTAQGYLFSQPRTPESFRQILESGAWFVGSESKESTVDALEALPLA